MAVRVNGENVDSAEVEQEIERLGPYYDQHVRDVNPDGGDEQLAEWALENVIERILLQQEAARDTEPISADRIDAAYEQVKDDAEDADAEQVKAHIARQMKLERLMQKISDAAGEPTDQQMRAFHKDNAEQFTSPEQIRASHIVKHIDGMTDHETARKAIEEIKAQLDKGASFEALAAEHSDCPDQAGDLGYFPRGQMVQEFEDVVFDLPVGEVSDVFLTSFGYHIAKVQDRREVQVAPFEQVREHIRDELADRMQKEAMERFVDELKAGAVIEDAPDAKPRGKAKPKPKKKATAKPKARTKPRTKAKRTTKHKA